MKKIISIISVFFLIGLLVLIFNIPKKENNKVTIISDYLFENYKISNNNIYDDYVYPSLTSKELLRYIQKDTTKISATNLSLHQQINNSKKIILSVGMNDFINDIKISIKENKISYDKKILSLHADVFINQFHQIIDEIHLINNNVQILYTSLYYPYPYLNDLDLLSFFDTVNKELRTIIENENGVYLDISSYSQEKYLNSMNDYRLNTIALNKIYNDLINQDSLHH